MMYLAWKVSGKRVAPFATEQAVNPKLTTQNSASRIGECVGAINRAVIKYGSLELALEAHQVWAKKNYAYADITNFIKFAPAGQRAKNVAKKVTPSSAVTHTVASANKALSSLPKAMRSEIIGLLGLR